jgi:hypothetical protein
MLYNFQLNLITFEDHREILKNIKTVHIYYIKL